MSSGCSCDWYARKRDSKEIRQPRKGVISRGISLMSFDPTHYLVRQMEARDYADLGEVCARVYPHDVPYTPAELAEHHKRFPQGQFVAEHLPTSRAVGAHFTLRLRMADFHIDDPWDVLTDHATFDDDNPANGHTLYGADVFASPDHQHHSLAHALTDA